MIKNRSTPYEQGFQNGRRQAFIQVYDILTNKKNPPSFTPIRPLSELVCEGVSFLKKEVDRLNKAEKSRLKESRMRLQLTIFDD